MGDVFVHTDLSSDDENYSPPPGLSMDTPLELFPGVSVVLPGEKEDARIEHKYKGDADDSKRKKKRKLKNRKKVVSHKVKAADTAKTKKSAKASEINDVTLKEKNVCIQGTNIVLDSPEDIKAWILERKKNWPTAKRIAEKEKNKTEEEKILQHYNGTGGKKGRKSGHHWRICKFWKRTGHCRNGKHCKFLHEQGTTIKRLPNNSVKLMHGIPVQIPHRFSPPVNCGKSLASLLAEGEHLKNENVKLLDLFERLVRTGAVSTDWDNLKKRLHLDSEAGPSSGGQ